ncbi:hypothetical protein LTR53_017025 [Teratosphaeriaceae sp. CCFEE 6253]|nr:hypothetical protein LTR53_017025 [Teratosphaeriaceae sp. CCFEE 6253]
MATSAEEQAAPTTPDREDISFMSLPAELRNRIYLLALYHSENNGTIAPASKADSDTMVYIDGALTKVTHQVRAESLSLFYAYNEFHFVLGCQSRPPGIYWDEVAESYKREPTTRLPPVVAFAMAIQDTLLREIACFSLSDGSGECFKVVNKNNADPQVYFKNSSRRFELRDDSLTNPVALKWPPLPKTGPLARWRSRYLKLEFAQLLAHGRLCVMTIEYGVICFLEGWRELLGSGELRLEPRGITPENDVEGAEEEDSDDEDEDSDDEDADEDDGELSHDGGRVEHSEGEAEADGKPQSIFGRGQRDVVDGKVQGGTRPGEATDAVESTEPEGHTGVEDGADWTSMMAELREIVSDEDELGSMLVEMRRIAAQVAAEAGLAPAGYGSTWR